MPIERYEKFKTKWKLEKLKISAYANADRTGKAAFTFDAMFNPESISQSFSVQYANPTGMGASSKSLTYSYRPMTTLAMKLILDEDCYDSWIRKITPQHHKSVKARVQAFLAAAYDIDSSIHQPRWLRLEWGTIYNSTTARDAALAIAEAMPRVLVADEVDRGIAILRAQSIQPVPRHPSFDCRLSSVDIKYTSFDREGSPTGAELDIVLIEDIADALRVREDNFQSPDVTHFRVVKAGDTLPLLSNSVYGDPSYYLTVAQFNGLDDFRNLQAGQKLYFPPLT